MLLFANDLVAQESRTTGLEIPDLIPTKRDRVQLAPLPDKDVEQRWYAKPVRWKNGRILGWDDKLVEIETAEGTREKFAETRVIGFEITGVTEPQQEALQAFANGDFGTSLPMIIRSLSGTDPSQRPPVWRQQWLSMIAAQAAMRSGRSKIAIELVSQLDRRPLPSMTLSLLPIDWLGVSNKPMQEAAVEGASSSSLAVKLVAASWLLRSEEYRTAATTAIARLAVQDERPRIAMLASQLRWLTVSPPELRSEELGQGLEAWESELRRLPMSLQTAPMLAIANQSRRVGDEEAGRRWALAVRYASPVWHPDLPRGNDSNR